MVQKTVALWKSQACEATARGSSHPEGIWETTVILFEAKTKEKGKAELYEATNT